MKSNDDKPAYAIFVCVPLTIIVVLEAITNTLDQKAHVLVLDGDKAFHAQDIMRDKHILQLCHKCFRIKNFIKCNDEAFKIVVFVIIRVIMMG